MTQQQLKANPLVGTLELALFLPAGVKRFPRSKKAALLSFIVPVTLMMIWVYPTSVVPTDVMGERSYTNLLSIHALIMVFHLGIFFALFWFLLGYIKRSEHFWTVISMSNFISLISFVLLMPLSMMVINGSHEWGDLYGALIVISCYELAIFAFALTRLLDVPWQLAGGLAFLSVFIWHAVSTSFYMLLGI